MENCLHEDEIYHEEFLLKSLKYMYMVERILHKKYLELPIY